MNKTNQDVMRDAMAAAIEMWKVSLHRCAREVEDIESHMHAKHLELKRIEATIRAFEALMGGFGHDPDNKAK